MLAASSYGRIWCDFEGKSSKENIRRTNIFIPETVSLIAIPYAEKVGGRIHISPRRKKNGGGHLPHPLKET